MSPTSDTSSCFYGDQGANRVALLRTVLLRADKRVERGIRRCSTVFTGGSQISQQLSCRLCPLAFILKWPPPSKELPITTQALKTAPSLLWPLGSVTLPTLPPPPPLPPLPPSPSPASTPPPTSRQPLGRSLLHHTHCSLAAPCL